MVSRLIKTLSLVILNLIAWAFMLIWGLTIMGKREAAPVALQVEKKV